MEVIIQPDALAISKLAARIFEGQLERKPNSVLGLTTGSTALALYRELAVLASADLVEFERATTFNLDEYVGLAPDDPRSCAAHVREHLLRKTGMPAAAARSPDGRAKDLAKHCGEYEASIARAGGIDLMLLGIGTDGHIGYNEPGSSLTSRTRIKPLSPHDREALASLFKDIAATPRHVITMGVGTIMESRHVLVLALGEAKAAAVANMVEGGVSADCPASILQMHQRCTVIVDEAAANGLCRRDYYRWAYENRLDGPL